MKTVLVLGVIAFAGVAYGAPEKYTSKYDGISIQEIIENERLLESYYKCLMDQGKCPPEGKELKAHMADALATNCIKCTEAQHDGVKLMIKHLVVKKPDYWKNLCEKYDPTGKYQKEHQAELEEYRKTG